MGKKRNIQNRIVSRHRHLFTSRFLFFWSCFHSTLIQNSWWKRIQRRRKLRKKCGTKLITNNSGVLEERISNPKIGDQDLRIESSFDKLSKQFNLGKRRAIDLYIQGQFLHRLLYEMVQSKFLLQKHWNKWSNPRQLFIVLHFHVKCLQSHDHQYKQTNKPESGNRRHNISWDTRFSFIPHIRVVHTI